MSSKATSPTANLLRNSRYFSLPRPLPLPNNEAFLGNTRRTDSATLPYPIQQAIVTTPKSLGRGDWGLKRPLPLRMSTRTSTPIFRLNAMDTREHITDYSSASDLSLNLKRLQELGLAVTTSSSKVRRANTDARTNVFEPSMDNTDAARDADSVARWKYGGPWLAGMSPGDFEDYVNKQLSTRKREFKEYIRRHALRKLRESKLAANRHEGRRLDEGSSDRIMPTEEEVDKYIRNLRNEFSLSSELTSLIEKFLDLPSAPKSSTLSSAALNYNESRSMYEQGPPTTHPSAGLTYLKSDAYLNWHPLFGAQRDRPPVEARVMVPPVANRLGMGGRIGIAGFIALESRGALKIRSDRGNANAGELGRRNDRYLDTIGVETAGGNRIWVHPNSLEVDSRGRVKLGSRNSSPTPVGIKTGELSDPTASHARQAPSIQSYDILNTTRPELRQTPGPGSGYGIGSTTKRTGSLLDMADETIRSARRR